MKWKTRSQRGALFWNLHAEALTNRSESTCHGFGGYFFRFEETAKGVVLFWLPYKHGRLISWIIRIKENKANRFRWMAMPQIFPKNSFV